MAPGIWPFSLCSILAGEPSDGNSTVAPRRFVPPASITETGVSFLISPYGEVYVGIMAREDGSPARPASISFWNAEMSAARSSVFVKRPLASRNSSGVCIQFSFRFDKDIKYSAAWQGVDC